MPAGAIIWCWLVWTESTWGSVSSSWRENRSLLWAMVRRGRPPPPLLAPRRRFAISNFARTERQSIRGRGGRRRTSTRHADDAQSFLSGFGRGDWRGGGVL